MEFYLGSAVLLSVSLFLSLLILFRAPTAFPSWFHSRTLERIQNWETLLKDLPVYTCLYYLKQMVPQKVCFKLIMVQKNILVSSKASPFLPVQQSGSLTLENDSHMNVFANVFSGSVISSKSRWGGIIRWSCGPQHEVKVLYLYPTWETAQTAAKPVTKIHIIVLYFALVRAGSTGKFSWTKPLA